MITIREYKKVESLEEAWQLNQKRSNRVIGGMLWTKMSRARVQTAIDLSGLGLDRIEESDEGFSIGCMVTLRQLETHEGLNRYSNGAVREALRHIVGVQFRNLATVGGSVFGRYGFSDVLTVLMAMDAQVELYRGGILPVSDFAKLPRDNDILVRVIVKKQPAVFCYRSVRNTDTDFPVLTCGAALTEAGLRICVGARPGCAILLEDTEGLLRAPVMEEHAVLPENTEGLPGVPAAERRVRFRETPAAEESGKGSEAMGGLLRVPAAEESGKLPENAEGLLRVPAAEEHAMFPEITESLPRIPASEKYAEEVGAFAAKSIPTGSNMRGSAQYRTQLVKTLVTRAVEELADMTSGKSDDVGKK